jgi:hypothetical protein
VTGAIVVTFLAVADSTHLALSLARLLEEIRRGPRG